MVLPPWRREMSPRCSIWSTRWLTLPLVTSSEAPTSFCLHPLRCPHVRQHVELGPVLAVSPQGARPRPFHLLDDPGPHPQPRQDRVPLKPPPRRSVCRSTPIVMWSLLLNQPAINPSSNRRKAGMRPEAERGPCQRVGVNPCEQRFRISMFNIKLYMSSTLN